MYTLEKSYVKKDWEWSVEDVKDWTLAEVFKDAQSILLIVTWANEGVSYSARIRDNTEFMATYDRGRVTVEEWLASFTEDKLILRTAPVGLSEAEAVRAFDLFDLKMQYKTSNTAFAQGVQIPIGLDNDYCFTNTGEVINPNAFDYYTKLEANSLFAVNGYVLPTVIHEGYIHILYGARYMAEMGHKITTVIDFSDLGGIVKEKFAASKITVLERRDIDIDNGIVRCTIDTDISLTGKCFFLVIGGYIFMMNGIYKDIGANKILVELEIKRFIINELNKPFTVTKPFEAANVLDSGAMANTFDPVSLLTQFDSFLVVTNTADLAMNQEEMRRSTVPGMYTFWRIPRGMTFYEDGLLAPIWTVGYNKDDAGFAALPRKRRFDLSNTVPFGEQKAIIHHGQRMRLMLNMDIYVRDVYSF